MSDSERCHPPGYLDYVAVLSAEEARALASEFRQKGLEHQRAAVDQLDKLVAGDPPQTCWVLVVVYEWESGLS